MFKNYWMIFSACFFCICFSEEIQIKENEEKLQLPNAQLKNLDNKKIEISSFIDSGPILISFWFLACEPCKKEMKFLNEFNEKYGDKGFKVVSINTDNSRGFRGVKPFINAKKYSFEVLSDPNGKFQQKLGGRECPYTVLIDHEGNIFSKHVGFKLGDEKKLEEEILILLDNFVQDSTEIHNKINDSQQNMK